VDRLEGFGGDLPRATLPLELTLLTEEVPLFHHVPNLGYLSGELFGE